MQSKEIIKLNGNLFVLSFHRTIVQSGKIAWKILTRSGSGSLLANHIHCMMATVRVWSIH